MAYLLLGREDQGPYPCKAGEFCGNSWGEEHNARMEALYELMGLHRFIGDDRPPGRPDWTLYKKGRPRPCEAGTTEQLEAQGMYGLYLRHDVEPYPDSCEPSEGPIQIIDTPPDLAEPPRRSSGFKTREQRRKDASERNAGWALLPTADQLASMNARLGGPCGARRQRKRLEAHK